MVFISFYFFVIFVLKVVVRKLNIFQDFLNCSVSFLSISKCKLVILSFLHPLWDKFILESAPIFVIVLNDTM